MTATSNGFSDGGILVMVALAQGLAIGLMIAAAGHISGGRYNPAVTISLWVGGKIGLIKALAYIISDFACDGATRHHGIRTETRTLCREITLLGMPMDSGYGQRGASIR